jgi:hypothetical protein
MLPRFPFALALALLAGASSVQAAPVAASIDASSIDCHFGPAKGLWKLPTPDGPGKVLGVLGTFAGEPLFRLEGKLVPSPAAQPGGPGGGALHEGVLIGALIAIPDAGESPEPFARVLGKWVAGPEGKGKFEALVVKHVGGPLGFDFPIGKIHGAFADAPPDPACGGIGPGHFQALWKICAPDPS